MWKDEVLEEIYRIREEHARFRFELFENILHTKLHSTLTNHEVISNVAIAMSLC
jgi:hypothetical protein